MRRYSEAFFDEIVHWRPESRFVPFFSPRRSRTSHTTIPSIARAVQPWRRLREPAPPWRSSAHSAKENIMNQKISPPSQKLDGLFLLA
ncbi:hypothetical protein, partial [Pseudomonas aeruginosa]|uniref:hypothetical protein n=1 Tax=Pseudomonas aeruginosa TaxID=287 RepID=UPI001A7ED057